MSQREFLHSITTVDGAVTALVLDAIANTDLALDGNNTHFLRGDGAWAVPPGGGGGGGFLPTMTTAARNAISAPAVGQIIFNTTIGQEETYDGSNWLGAGMASRGVVNVLDYGADSTGATYSDAAFAAAIAVIEAFPLDPGGLARGGRIYVPVGTYKLSQTLFFRRSILMEGAQGAGWNSGTQLNFDSGITGINVTSFLDTGSGANGRNGSWSVIRDLSIISGNTFGGGVAPGPSTAHGIDMRARAKVSNCWIRGFSGNGINIDTSWDNTGTAAANGFVLDFCRIDFCGGFAVYTRGTNSNAGVVTGLDIANCTTGGGIHEDSFLGNTYVMCQVADCSPARGFETTSPGTPNYSNFIGCYNENNGASSFSGPNVLLLGGNMLAPGFTSNSQDRRLIPDVNGLAVTPALTNTTVTSTSFGSKTLNAYWSPQSYFGSSDDSQTEYRWFYSQSTVLGTWDLWYHWGATGTALMVSLTNSAAPVGGGKLIFPSGFNFGNASNLIAQFRADATWQPPHLADASAVNDSTYYSTTGSKFAYKDPTGVVNYFSGGAVTSVHNSDGTLTISPTVGVVVAGLNLSNVNNWSASQTINLNSTSAFEVGPATLGQPTFVVVTNVASAATGLSITANAAGAGVTLSALSTGTNENIILAPKGTAAVSVGTLLLRSDSSLEPGHLADGSAVSDSLYYSTTGSKLAYKDPSGNLYYLNAPASAWFGDGSDGALTYDGAATILGVAPVANVYTLTRDVYATNLTVNAPVTIKTNSFRLFATGTLLNNGTISNAGAVGANGSGGTAGGTTAGTPNTGTLGGSGIGQAGGAASGSSGGTGGNGTGSTTNGDTASSGAGGLGGPGNAGGAGGGAGAAGVSTNKFSRTISLQPNWNNAGTMTAMRGGCGGSGGGAGGNASGQTSGGGGGGGGGAGGGPLFIGAQTVTNNGTITCAGGSGGNGASATLNGGGGGAGGGGGGGWLCLVYLTTTALGVLAVSGGGAGIVGSNGGGTGTGGGVAASGAQGILLRFNLMLGAYQ